MAFDWSTIFDNFGIKKVGSTDKSKSAYVPNEDQKVALAAAGKDPSLRATFAIEVLFDTSNKSLISSYYNSKRKKLGRTPEARIGRGLVHWAQVGDEIVIGNKGARVIACKVSASPSIASEAGRQLAKNGNKKKILARAKKATGKPAQAQSKVTVFVRNPYVVAAALIRADGSCEVPACTRRLFKRDDGSVFLEVHHIVPLAEGGEDSLANAAAICPACHREAHHGRKRAKLRTALAAEIAAKPLP